MEGGTRRKGAEECKVWNYSQNLGSSAKALVGLLGNDLCQARPRPGKRPDTWVSCMN